jgi:hypothetical protein
MKWAQLAEIRNHTLAKFLEDTYSKEEALKKFADVQIDDPPFEEIDAYFASLEVAHAASSEPDVSTETVLTDTTTAVKKTKNATGTI